MFGKTLTIWRDLVTCLQGSSVSSHWNSGKSKILKGTVFTEISYNGNKNICFIINYTFFQISNQVKVEVQKPMQCNLKGNRRLIELIGP